MVSLGKRFLASCSPTNNMNEPDITINGVKLTQGQAMTIRVALQTYAIDMSQPDALGSDATGRSIAKGYLRNISSINDIIALTP